MFILVNIVDEFLVYQNHGYNKCVTPRLPPHQWVTLITISIRVYYSLVEFIQVLTLPSSSQVFVCFSLFLFAAHTFSSIFAFADKWEFCVQIISALSSVTRERESGQEREIESERKRYTKRTKVSLRPVLCAVAVYLVLLTLTLMLLLLYPNHLFGSPKWQWKRKRNHQTFTHTHAGVIWSIKLGASIAIGVKIEIKAD